MTELSRWTVDPLNRQVPHQREPESEQEANEALALATAEAWAEAA